MLRTGIVFGCLTALVSSGLASACTSTMDDCMNTSTCPPTAGTSNGGGAGEAGTGGTSGASNGGSTAGDAGETNGGTTSDGGGSGTGGMAGEGGAGGGECDATKTPTEEACLVSDDYAIFVAPDGDDGNAGSKDAPLASLTKAIEVAAGDKIVLVCSGSYDEQVTITAGAHIFGGFKCADWSPDTSKALFKPTTSGPALMVNTVADELLIENLGFEVSDATASGATALAAIVNASPKVTLRSVSLKAGKGKTGANGTLTGFAFPDAGSLNGNPESSAGTGGAGKTCMCQATLSSTGGIGGSPIVGGQSGSKGQPDLGGGLGGDPAAGDCGAGSTGKKGTDAMPREASAGAVALGTASASGWQPSSGIDGLTGSPGQGGGGGASLNASGHGGGGGCGGCGGNGGTAGKGGGGSIALLAVNSPMVVEASTLTTADAGSGGSGAAGELATADVGAGAGVVSSLNSCPGGNGGKGGAGGAGGGGAGGVSAGIVWNGLMAPTVSVDTTITIGKAGTKGAGSVPGTNDGIAGVAQKVLPLN
jgi:hypothetical protein